MRVFQIQRWSAIALLVFLTIHMTVVHYPPFHIDFSQIIVRMGQPLWKAIDVAFLFFVLLHAVSGAYAVLIDLGGLARLKRALAASAVLLALVGFVYGTLTILAFQPPV